MRIGLIGDGAVAAIHARVLRRLGADVCVVYSTDADQASRFAKSNGIACGTDRFSDAVENCDIAIVASPGECHFAQAQVLIAAGRHCLVELPVCSSAAEAHALKWSAHEHNVNLECAHTSRYLPGMRQVTNLLSERALGDIRHVMGVRSILPRNRTWIDDALLHHAAHYVDLILFWFGELTPAACVAKPQMKLAQDVSLAGRLLHGAPMSVSVSYTSRLAEARLTIVGSEHTVATDGFSYVESDEQRLNWQGDAQENYERSIESQDSAFLEACHTRNSAVPWDDTIRLAECLDRFRILETTS